MQVLLVSNSEVGLVEVLTMFSYSFSTRMGGGGGGGQHAIEGQVYMCSPIYR